MKSSLKELQDFKESFIWKDICEVLRDWHGGLADDVVDLDGTELQRCLGNMQGTKYFLGIVDTMIQGLSHDIKEERKDANRSDSSGGNRDGQRTGGEG